MNEIFGKRFRQLRQELDLKQQELIDDFNKKYNYNFTRVAVSQYENGKRIPEIDALSAFAEYFGVSVDFLLGKSDARNITPNPKEEQPKITTIATHRIDYGEDLPEEARKQLDDYIKFLRQQYGKKNNDK